MQPTPENDQYKYHTIKNKHTGRIEHAEWTGTHWVDTDNAGEVNTPAALHAKGYEYVGVYNDGGVKVVRTLGHDPLAELAKIIGQGDPPYTADQVMQDMKKLADTIPERPQFFEPGDLPPEFLIRKKGVADFNKQADSTNRRIGLIKFAERHSKLIGGFFMGTTFVLVGLLVWLDVPEGAPWWFTTTGIGIGLIAFQLLALLNMFGLLLFFGDDKVLNTGTDFDWTPVTEMWPQNIGQDVQWFVPSADSSTWNVVGGYIFQCSHADLADYEDGDDVTHWKPLALPPLDAVVPHIEVPTQPDMDPKPPRGETRH